MLGSSPWNRLYFTREQCEESLSKAEVAIIGAVSSGGRVLGFLASMENGIGFEPLIEYVCVDELLRGGEIGTKLIDHFENVLFPSADNMYLFVSDINPKAARLYIRLGYLPVGALADFNLEMQTEFLFRKSRRPRQAARMLEAREQQDGVGPASALS